METLVTGATAALLTLFDLDKTFYIPSKVNQKIVLYAWWVSFILINGLLAILLFYIVRDISPLQQINPWLKAVIIGIGYLALIRLKFATFNFQGKEVPFGLEAFYDAGKLYVYKRINAIAIKARRDETVELANNEALEKLAQDTKFYIEANSLLTIDEKREQKTWLLRILQDTTITEMDKKITFANYIKSGQMITY